MIENKNCIVSFVIVFFIITFPVFNKTVRSQNLILLNKKERPVKKFEVGDFIHIKMDCFECIEVSKSSIDSLIRYDNSSKNLKIFPIALDKIDSNIQFDDFDGIIEKINKTSIIIRDIYYSTDTVYDIYYPSWKYNSLTLLDNKKLPEIDLQNIKLITHEPNSLVKAGKIFVGVGVFAVILSTLNALKYKDFNLNKDRFIWQAGGSLGCIAIGGITIAIYKQEFFTTKPFKEKYLSRKYKLVKLHVQ